MPGLQCKIAMAKLKKQMKSFRLPVRVIETIKELAETQQLAQADIIEMAVTNYQIKRRNK